MENLRTQQLSIEDAISFGRHFAEIGDFHQADRFFQLAVQIEQTITAHLEYADFLRDCLSTQQAIRVLENALEAALDDQNFVGKVRLCNRLASIYREENNTVRAKQYQQAAIAADLKTFNGRSETSLSAESMLGQAQDLVADGELSTAKSLLLALIRDDTKTGVEASFLIAKISLKEKDLDATKAILGDLDQTLSTQRDPKLTVSFHVIESHFHMASKQYGAARVSIEKALTSALNSPRCGRQLPRLKSYRKQILLTMSVACQTAQWN